LLLFGYFCNKKANSAWLLNQLPKPKVLTLYQTNKSTIFSPGALVNHNDTRSVPRIVLFTHNKQKLLGFNTLSISPRI
jgi:hypothetical protein